MRIVKLFSESSIAIEGIQELKEVLEFLKSQGVDEENVSLDFSIARGLDYYTGTVMETVLLDLSNFGSVFSGGRYNKLVKQFTGKDLPVVGASIGVDRLFTALEKLDMVNCKQKTSAEVMVLRLMRCEVLQSVGDKITGNDDLKDINVGKEYLKIAQNIRDAGLNTTICYLEDTTFKSQFNFALNSGVKYVVIVGEKEFKNGTVQVKNLQVREQIEVMRDDLMEYFVGK